MTPRAVPLGVARLGDVSLVTLPGEHTTVLGERIEVPTIHGRVQLALPKNTSSGRAFRIKGKGVNVGFLGCRHLPALDFRYASMRIKNEDIDIFEATKSLHRGRAGVARRGTDDRQMRIAARQEGFEQLAKQL